MLSLSLCFACIALTPRAPPPRPSRPPLQPASAVPVFDPLQLRPAPPAVAPAAAAAAAAALLPAFLGLDAAHAEDALSFASNPALDPANFQPVCPASDGFYRFGQTIVVGLVGGENYKEFAPLIAGGLLRVRLELCVVESFVYEAIIPFIREKGLSWVLPLHETVETFLAGVIFAVASNFILIGSTKLVTVIFTYGDLFLGFPFRFLGGIGWRSLEEGAIPPKPVEDPPPSLLARLFRKEPERLPPTLDEVIKANEEPLGVAGIVVWGSMRVVGELSRNLRRGIEVLDLFVGRYLLLTTVAYVGIKFVHYKVFDPFPL